MPEMERLAIGERARDRVLAGHTAAHRAAELESYVMECYPLREKVSPGFDLSPAGAA
jgi:hypothetical protein